MEAVEWVGGLFLEPAVLVSGPKVFAVVLEVLVGATMVVVLVLVLVFFLLEMVRHTQCRSRTWSFFPVEVSFFLACFYSVGHKNILIGISRHCYQVVHGHWQMVVITLLVLQVH